MSLGDTGSTILRSVGMVMGIVIVIIVKNIVNIIYPSQDVIMKDLLVAKELEKEKQCTKIIVVNEMAYLYIT